MAAYTAIHDDAVTLFTSSWKDRPSPSVARELRARVVDRRVPVSVLNYLWHRLEWPAVETLAGASTSCMPHTLLIPSRRAARIVTIHDLFFSSIRSTPAPRFGETMPSSRPTTRAARRRSSHRPNTKRLVIDHLGVSPERVYICPPGAPTWRRSGRAPNNPHNGYILLGTSSRARTSTCCSTRMRPCCVGRAAYLS